MGVRQKLAESQSDAVLAARSQALVSLVEAELLQPGGAPPLRLSTAGEVRLAAGEEAPEPVAELPSMELLQRLVAEEGARAQAPASGLVRWRARGAQRHAPLHADAS